MGCWPWAAGCSISPTGMCFIRTICRLSRRETLGEGRQCWNPGSVALPKAGSPHSYMILEGAWVQWKDLSGGTYHTLTVG